MQVEIQHRQEIERLQIADNWGAIAKRLQKAYPHLTAMDLNYEPGKENELIYAIQNRLYLTQMEVIQLIKKTQENTGNIYHYRIKRVSGKSLFANSVNISDHEKHIKLYSLFKSLFLGYIL